MLYLWIGLRQRKNLNNDLSNAAGLLLLKSTGEKDND